MPLDTAVRLRLLLLLSEPDVGAGDEDAELMVGFWERARLRAAGRAVPFDAEGLERLRSKV